MEPRSAYIHVPFCAHRCGYCNFTVIAGRDDLAEPYLRAIELELNQLERPHPVDTLFIGGGTPTQLSAVQLRRLLKLALHWFPLRQNYEFTVEANPSDLNEEKSDVLLDAGVNRISLGVQSFHPDKLARLERDHNVEQILAAVELARRFASFSLDLIFGAPGESRIDWERDVESAIELRPHHISAYGLTFEKGTTFWSRLNRGALQPCDEEEERHRYLFAIERITRGGFQHYEVSNFALPGHQSRHNETYWSGREYHAVGPGASRYVDGCRETNHRSTVAYLKKVLNGESPVAEAEQLSPEDRARESLVFGLRRMAGVERAEFAKRFGYSIDLLAGGELARLSAQGLLECDDRTVRLTNEGLLISDSIWPLFLRG